MLVIVAEHNFILYTTDILITKAISREAAIYWLL